MDFRYTPEQEAFRARLRDWLERNKVEVFGDSSDPLAERDTEAFCLRLSRYRSLTAQLNGRVPGPESSFGKLHATELNLRVATFADELLGPMHSLSEARFARLRTVAGAIGCCGRVGSQSLPDRVRSSTTSLASGCCGCRKGKIEENYHFSRWTRAV